MRSVLRHFLFVMLLGGLGVAATGARAQSGGELDGATQEALRKTQDVLKDRKAREEIIQKSAAARAADQRVKDLGPEHTESIYQISSEAMGQLVQQTRGDDRKMQQTLEELQKNPEALNRLLSPEQRQKIKDLAHEIENPRGPASP